MKRFLVGFVCTLLASACTAVPEAPRQIPDEEAEAIIREIEESHIQGNVPPAQDFERLLRRDLTSYFSVPDQPAPDLEYELLRDGPTQTGIAFPKFYVWVRIDRAGVPLLQGAAQAAAIQRERFSITDFVSEAEIKRDPSQLYRVFQRP